MLIGARGSEFRALFLLWGGDCNDGLRCGAAFNVNNPFSNSNWNIGPSPVYRKTDLSTKCSRPSYPTGRCNTPARKGSREN